MEKILYTNSKGQTVELSNVKPFMVLKVDGSGGVNVDTQLTKSPYQDGSTYHDSVLDARRLSITGAIIGDNDADVYAKRQELSGLFTPKGKGTLTYVNDAGEKQIGAVVSQPPVYRKKTGSIQEFMIGFICPTPFWEDTFIESGEMADWVYGLSFPLQLGTKFSERGFQRAFTNAGDVETPIEVTFYLGGLNPSITNLTTGEFIKVNKEILATEKLIINTSFGNKKVEIEDADGNRTNAFHYIDLDSTFFNLQQGDNLITYGTEAGQSTTKVKITWRNRYLGM